MLNPQPREKFRTTYIYQRDVKFKVSDHRSKSTIYFECVHVHDYVANTNYDFYTDPALPVLNIMNSALEIKFRMQKTYL